MQQSIFKLSVFLFLVGCAHLAKADSFSLSSTACSLINNRSRRDVRLELYDKAMLLAIKSSDYMKSKNLELEEYDYTLLSYKIADSSLKDIVIATTIDNDEKICIELSGKLSKSIADNIIASFASKQTTEQTIDGIVDEINTIMPQTLGASDNNIPLIYIEDLEYHNQTKTKKFSSTIEEQLRFYSNILITENYELADYFLSTKMLKSSIDKLDKDNSKFSMSVVVNLYNTQREIVLTEQKNRYVIIKNDENTQVLAKKMLLKLIKEALQSMSDKMSKLK